MSKQTHPFYLWIKANGLMMAHVARQVDLHPRTLGRYIATGKAPLLVRRAVDQYTGGAVPFDQWGQQ